MSVTVGGQVIAGAQGLKLGTSKKWSLAIACLCAGVAPLAARWIPDDRVRIACGLVLAAAYLGFALYARQQSTLRGFWELSLAFFVLALVQVLNNALPGFVGTDILHDRPNSGNPFASTVSGTVLVQLLDTLIAIGPVIMVTRLSGSELGSIYAQRGVVGRWLLFAVVFLFLFYVFVATIPLRPGSFAERLLPTNGTLTLARFLALSPALVVVAVSNGFEEEFLFRGLFLQKYELLFGARVANVLQATIFSVAHLGVTYTPSALLFIVVWVFPLALIAGYLMRTTKSVITPSIFHGALDMAIYLVFLSYVS